MSEPSDAPQRADLLFDALLLPHRSLSPRGFLLLMALVGATSFCAGLVCFLIGAWPVVGFLGLEVALIYGAFRLNYRQARLYETVRLTRRDLTVERIGQRGDVSTWRFQPAWLQVQMDDPPRPTSQLVLRSHGRSLPIGRFLTAQERSDLAAALRAALTRARTACRPCAPAPL